MSKRRYPINPQEWLNEVSGQRDPKSLALLGAAIDLYDSKSTQLLEKGLGIADILLTLGLDNETLAATIAYPALQAGEIHPDSIIEVLGEDARKLLHDVLQMQSLGKIQHLEQRGGHQLENLRKMLLAMVTDVRAVLVIIAERLWLLRNAKLTPPDEQLRLANETLAVYAPLANRLGVWQLKWEIEDLCLRYTKPDVYAQIAKGISSRRDEREDYIKEFMQSLNNELHKAGIVNFQTSGRAKHIYSIYKKMQRKNANLEQIYDMSALRVLVDTIEDCYSALSILQNGWEQVPEEFDDYISHPKPNGYQSIHVVLVGPKLHFVEVQIRTYQMHQESELGVAAHWRYKEGVLQTSNYETKIALLRELVAWQKEVVSSGVKNEEKTSKDLFADRIYVFTPQGDIVDLPKGATPLDFAYTIHSEVGHRCRGAKIDGNIVSLKDELQMGQRIEILTAKHANPSRDWMNPHLGFIKTPRARAKVAHWFRIKDSTQYAVDGRELLDKELKKHGISTRIDLPAIASKLKYKSGDDLLAALASGDIRITQITNLLQASSASDPVIVSGRENESLNPNIKILGINNLLTHIAKCCRPLPGDTVIGYVTRNRGVSIHRRDCTNMLNVKDDSTNRMIEVDWGSKEKTHHPADLFIRVFDRSGLLRDITTLLASEKINVLGLQTQKTNDTPEVDIFLTIEISDKEQLHSAIALMKRLPNVIQVRRR